MRTDDLDFALPPELIAQQPAAERSASRLLVYRTADASIEHRAFRDLPSLLAPGDLLVFNDARVLPARFTLIKPTGGRVPGLFLADRSVAHGAGAWEVMLKNPGPLAPGATLAFDADPAATVDVVEKLGDGRWLVRASDPADPTGATPARLLARVGRMPLPPYIRGDRSADARDAADADRYQTVYASAPGSVAAPTAGLHFDAALLDALAAAGVGRTHLTLHVGAGTFKPVSADRLEDHPMHAERYDLSADAAEAINAAKDDGRRVITVGTTAARVLESQPPGPLIPTSGATARLIRPPHAWRHTGALVTNFHLPRSTLLALVAARIGLGELRRAYAAAVTERYRFFSYGDAMLIV